MARPTRLRILGSRDVPAEIAGEPDNRPVIQAFPPPPAPAERGSPLGDDILELLRKSHERIAGEAHQAVSVATSALDQASAATAGITALTERAASIETQTARIGETMLAGLADRGAAKTAARQASLGVIQRLLTFAVDRAPAFLALGAAVWLWGSALADPKPMQLIALGLFGAVVVAPAVWLSARKA